MAVEYIEQRLARPTQADAALGPAWAGIRRQGMKAFRMLVAASALFLLAACYPVTTASPIGTTVGFSTDTALAGLWRAEMAQSDDEVVFFHFLPMDDGSFKVVIVSGGEKLNGEWSVARVRAASLGSHHFLNAEMVFNNGKQESDPSHGTVPLLYRYESHGRVSLFLMSEDKAKEAIQSGAVAGAIEPGDFGDVTLTAEPDDLDKFFAGDDGAALFTQKFATLTKVSQ
jgi:hypothetical protein